MWMIREADGRRLEDGKKLGLVPTPELVTKFAETRITASSGAPECLTIAGDIAQIAVVGVLTPQPDFWAWLLYGANTSYAEIGEAVAIALANPSVKRIEFFIDSPGGMVAGLFELLALLEQATGKKITVRASLAASAAYAIAAVAGPIEATSVAAEFGSIGVAQTFVLHADETVIDITSTEAPDKRPDPETPEGQAVIRRELDAIHQVFVETIARGRGTTVEDVNANFGRGAVFIAGEAASRKMIDKAPSGRSSTRRAAAATAPAVGPQTARALALSEGMAARCTLPGESQTALARRMLATLPGVAPKDPPTPPREPTGDLGDQVALRMLGRRRGIGPFALHNLIRSTQ